MDALKRKADLGLVYWSKSQKKFLHRVVTPLELTSHSLKAFDHFINEVRVFRVTRIRRLAVVPSGSRSVPPLLRVPIPKWAMVGLGVAAALLAAAVWRAQRPRAVAVPKTPEAVLESVPVPLLLTNRPATPEAEHSGQNLRPEAN